MNKEIIILGRGGQGAVTCSQIIAEAAFLSGKFKDVTSIPTFGTERRGTPVMAFTRLSDYKIWTRQSIKNPDFLLVLDSSILNNGMIKIIKPNGALIINIEKCANDVVKEFNISEDITVICANITYLCIESNLILDGEPLVSVPILGLIPKIIEQIEFKFIVQAIQERFNENLSNRYISIAKKIMEIADIRKGKNI